MMRIINALPLLMAAVATTGCAVIPGTESTLTDTRNTAPMSYSSRNDIRTVAKCITKNIEETYGSMSPTLQDMFRSDLLEVRVRSPIGVAAIIEVEPTSQGSVVTTRVSNHYPMKETLMKAFTKNC